MSTITARVIRGVKPADSVYFVRDTKLKGFAIRVFPSGTIKYVAEVWHNGRSHRKTLGTYPVLGVNEARKRAIVHMQDVHSGAHKKATIAYATLGSLFVDYVESNGLKPSTLKSYREVVHYYLKDWLQKPVSSITKEMVQSRFYRIKDKGINGGMPTYSQATKAMRILSALMNYAMADDIVQSNPVDVLKQKRVDRSMRKRTSYLPANKAQELLNKTLSERVTATIAVHLMLHTGLRKTEALSLRWSDIVEVEGIKCLLIADTKNHRPHYIPVTKAIQRILDRCNNSNPFLFPSAQKQGRHIVDVRGTLKRLSKLIDMEFKCHDLRRTFATRASEVGIDYLMVKRLLNHKSNDITSQYIQWNSRQNLLLMRDALERITY